MFEWVNENFLYIIQTTAKVDNIMVYIYAEYKQHWQEVISHNIQGIKYKNNLNYSNCDL